MVLCHTKNIQSDILLLQSTYAEVDSDCVFKLSSKQLKPSQAVIYCYFSPCTVILLHTAG